MRKLVVGSIVLAFLLVSSGLLLGYAGAAERARPIRIGALTDSWGPTPQVVGLRDGLVELGYREHEDFVFGVRFTQGDLAALFAAARVWCRMDWKSFSPMAIMRPKQRSGQLLGFRLSSSVRVIPWSRA